MGSTVTGRFRLTGRLRQNKSFAAVTRAAMLERPVSKVQRSSNLQPPKDRFRFRRSVSG